MNHRDAVSQARAKGYPRLTTDTSELLLLDHCLAGCHGAGTLQGRCRRAGEPDGNLMPSTAPARLLDPD